MQKDLKIGLFVGLILVIAATVYLATRKSLSISSRIRLRQTTEPETVRFEFPLETITKPQPALPESDPTQDLTRYEEPNIIKTQKFHIVRPNETLSTIAKKHYGNPGNWRKIYNANRNQLLKGPDKLKTGTKLIIPD